MIALPNKEATCLGCGETIIFTLTEAGTYECKEGYYRYFADIYCNKCGSDKDFKVKP